MQIIPVITTQLTILFSMMTVGWLLNRTGALKDEKPLSALLTRAVLPAMMVGKLQIPYSQDVLADLGTVAAGVALVIILGLLAGFLIGVVARKPFPERGAWVTCSAFPNAIFIGAPLTFALFGEQSASLMVAVSFSFNVLIFTLGVWMLSKGTGKGKLGDPHKLFNPTVVGSLAGLALFLMPFRLPAILNGTLDLLASMMTPLSMVILGCQIAKSNPRSMFLNIRVYLLSAIRLLLVPIISFFILRIFVRDPLLLGTLTVVSAMPSAAMVSIVASEQDNQVELCSNVVCVSTILCLVTVPFIMWLLLG